MSDGTISSKLDQVIGQLIIIQQEQASQGGRIGNLCERMALVEEGVNATKDVVSVWGAAKISLRFVKGWATVLAALASLLGALAALYFRCRGGLTK